MGACAGCVGPNRRAENYRVNRLTEDSPIKSRVTPSELPVTQHKIRIIEELNESKRRLQGNNLISTLINSPLTNSPQLHFTSSKILTSYNPRESHLPQMLIRDSYDVGIGKRSMVGQLQLRKVESGPLDENSYSGYDNRYVQESSRPFASEFKLTNMPLISGSLVSTPPKTVLSELKLPNRNSEFARFTKGRELGNIPELPDEDSKTPNYVKQIRRKNGEDVKRTDLAHVPRQLDAVPGLDLFKYLKDLQ